MIVIQIAVLAGTLVGVINTFGAWSILWFICVLILLGND